MKRFNKKGFMIFPRPSQIEKDKDERKVIVVKECYCPNGHNLVTGRANFNGFDGILLKVKNPKKTGIIALSPMFGDKSRISLDIHLVKDEIYDIYCPVCDVKLPVYTKCTCGADLITFFSTENIDYSDCIGICNRVGCPEAVVQDGGELLSRSDILKRW